MYSRLFTADCGDVAHSLGVLVLGDEDFFLLWHCIRVRARTFFFTHLRFNISSKRAHVCIQHISVVAPAQASRVSAYSH